ncbi:hypothetical protein P280DRAFT_276508 [Massarina eburnea CBS 473.64]|uniref:BZIP domain-containing protein n=1 Tax=Massarina eburnea CBS 473.64 TaxID=1395130 RepID=A0A6A6S765_9PLEO|nr:hypothetical protein P280DRAFT_276508 [Massarina eburnea CBS 473.64]
MPVERRKKTKTAEEVPETGDPERKRVLNVLAQRRYRQRQREKTAALEAQAKSQSAPQPFPRAQDGGVQVIPEHSTSSLESPPDDDEIVEEAVRSSADLGFPDMSFGQGALDMSLFDDFSLGSLPTPSPLSSSWTGSTASSTCPPSFSFPLSSDAQLDVPILSAMRGFIAISTALNISSVIWDPDYLHTLPAVPLPNLPWNLQPTPAQMTIPHHPMLDALPWPSVRERLICILSLPSMCRPPVAQDDGDPCGTGQAKAIQRLTHDLDDFREGVRVHGNVVGWNNSSELVEEAWEMGEMFYRNWWFCVDQKAVETTNRRRRERGLGALKLQTL